jgi:hypothetical protein
VPYTDLLRITVLLTAAEATALGAITAVAAQRDDDTTTLLVCAVWWAVALIIGLFLGAPSRAGDGVREVLSRARTATSLPPESDARIAIGRLWPIALTAVAAGVAGIFWPGVSAIAAGYALLVSLMWRTQEAAVLGVEEYEGTRFYVLPGSALAPVELVKTAGLMRNRPPNPKPPPPPPAEA